MDATEVSQISGNYENIADYIESLPRKVIQVEKSEDSKKRKEKKKEKKKNKRKKGNSV